MLPRADGPGRRSVPGADPLRHRGSGVAQSDRSRASTSRAWPTSSAASSSWPPTAAWSTNAARRPSTTSAARACFKQFLQGLFSGPRRPRLVVRWDEIDKSVSSAASGTIADNTGVSQDMLKVLLDQHAGQQLAGHHPGRRSGHRQDPLIRLHRQHVPGPHPGRRSGSGTGLPRRANRSGASAP